MIRALRPTDVVAYLAFRSSSPTSQALLRVDGKTSAPTIRQFLGGSLALEPNRSSWILVDRRRIAGLAGARVRQGSDVWDVDQLIAEPAEREELVYARLLEHLCGRAVEEGVQKVYLRLDVSSDANDAAKRAGFRRYATEQVYCYVGALPRPSTGFEGLRPRRPIDHQALFQLYCAAVPPFVRQIEGLTLQEWRWTDGWRLHSIPWRPRSQQRRDFVVWREEALAVWLRIDVTTRSLTVLTNGHDPALLGAALEFGIARLGPGGPIVLPLREYQEDLRAQIEALGFQPIGQHALLARMLANRVPEARLVPVQAL